MTLNQIIVIILAIFLIWWPIGGIINRARGQAWLEWLQSGMGELGARNTYKWLRSFHNVGQITVNELRLPFRVVEVLFTLEPRDNLIFWIIRHLGGRRDEMILMAYLQDNPVQEVEVGYHGRRSYDAYLAQQKDNPFTQLPGEDKFRIAWRGKPDETSIRRLKTFLSAEGKSILRLSLQKVIPVDQRTFSTHRPENLLLRTDMTRMKATSPSAFFAALRNWASDLEVEESKPVEEPPASPS